jgi:hypothetical protein
MRYEMLAADATERRQTAGWGSQERGFQRAKACFGLPSRSATRVASRSDLSALTNDDSSAGMNGVRHSPANTGLSSSPRLRWRR